MSQCAICSAGRFFLYHVNVNCKRPIETYSFIIYIQQGIPDDSDEFGEFRIRVADLIKDCVFIVGSGNCFSQVRKRDLLLNIVQNLSQSHPVNCSPHKRDKNMMFAQNLQKPLTVSIMQLSFGFSEFSLIVVFLAGIPLFSLILL